jgi:hypothetical protein
MSINPTFANESDPHMRKSEVRNLQPLSSMRMHEPMTGRLLPRMSSCEKEDYKHNRKSSIRNSGVVVTDLLWIILFHYL